MAVSRFSVTVGTKPAFSALSSIPRIIGGISTALTNTGSFCENKTNNVYKIILLLKSADTSRHAHYPTRIKWWTAFMY